MGKHAYLITCNGKWEQLRFLTDLLNDPRNDLFILVDLKSKDFDKDRFLSTCQCSSIHLVTPVKIYWGDYSQIRAYVSLLNAATQHGKYDYYHLISGVDMPLKPQNEIHRFFDLNRGTEFVDFDSFNDNTRAIDRVKYYYFFQKQSGRRRISFMKTIQRAILLIEKLIRTDRIKEIEPYLGKGANWFSITDDFARYIVNNNDFIEKHFKRTFCADEVVFQTLLKMSPFKNNWYGFKDTDIQYQNMRWTDWNRGKPYTFRKDEFSDLCKSKYLFARKFDTDIVSDEVRKLLK